MLAAYEVLHTCVRKYAAFDANSMHDKCHGRPTASLGRRGRLPYSGLDMLEFSVIRQKGLAILFLEEHQGWMLFATLVLCVASYTAASVYYSLAAVRPLLVFVLVDGALPPVCGFCVLFGG